MNDAPRSEPHEEFDIPDALSGERLDRAVSMLTGCSRSAAADAVVAGQVLVDGVADRRVSRRLTPGARVAVVVDPAPRPEPLRANPSVEFSVVHADDDLAVIDKPAGLVVHPGPGHRDDTLVNGLLARFPQLDPASGDTVGDPERPGIVHRLDRGTSGLLVVALRPSAHEHLVAQLADHDVDRIYSALVRGVPGHDRGVIDAPIGRSRRNPLRMTVSAEGRPARTHYTLDEAFTDPEPVALLTCRLETGRTHQIRVHLDSVGHPVLGDDLYGPQRPVLPIGRPFLHARELSFDHPGSGERVRFTSPMPSELADVLEGLRSRRVAEG